MAIARLCSIATIVKLTRCDRQLHAICEPILYRSTSAVRWAVLTSTDEKASLQVLVRCKQRNLNISTVRLHNVPVSRLLRQDRSYDRLWDYNDKHVSTMTPFQCAVLKGLDSVVCFLLGNGFRKDSLPDRCIWRCLLFLNRQTNKPEQEADKNNHSFGCEHIAAATGLLMVMVHLLVSGHSINCTDRNSRTQVDYAEKYGIASNNIVQCLRWLASWVSKSEAIMA